MIVLTLMVNGVFLLIYIVDFIALIILLLLLWQSIIGLKHYKLHLQDDNSNLRFADLPTISLCVPARNETHALEDCLTSAIASDYPKLEIIVLDDCSQDRTSQIIRGFAHDGVRFVQGKVPSEDWLGKNNAYDVLAQEARGEYLVFMSVDTRIDPQALTTLVEYMQNNKLSMLSVLPRRLDLWRASVLFAPLRYFWQIVLPLRINMPTATSLWAIRSKSLFDIGGISAYKDKIMLENVLAKQFYSQNSYRFLVSNNHMKVWYAKKWSSQKETAIRLWYPLLQKNVTYCLVAIISHFLLFVFPLFSFITGVVSASVVLMLLSSTALLLGYSLFYFYLRQVQTGASSLVGALILPLLALQEIALIIASFYQYKRGHVSWKGRNVCYPALRRHF